jgi:ATP-dependent helicase HepA
MTKRAIPEGCLVAPRTRPRHIGKAIKVCGHSVTVEWFLSVADRATERFSAAELARAGLEPQTRCYVSDEYGSQWRMGRVMGVSVCKDGTGLEYQVDFPNGQAAYVGEENVYVRVPGASADPVDTLICRGQETPYFHERRGAFVRSLIEQRAASAGLSALVSASIRLYRHQVEAVRKVLQDPVLRYLLADEVGLGKTIEAGVVIRQVLLDDPDARALVLVPGALVSQWRAELCGKFRLREDDGRLTVGPYSDAHRYGEDRKSVV